MSAAEMVAEFHQAANIHPGHGRDGSTSLLRSKLHAEENRELLVELYANNRVGIARELADVLYIAYGTAYVYGIDLDAVFAEVHRANMTKVGPDGVFELNADGKILKGARFVAPDIARVLGEAT